MLLRVPLPKRKVWQGQAGSQSMRQGPPLHSVRQGENKVNTQDQSFIEDRSIDRASERIQLLALSAFLVFMIPVVLGFIFGLKNSSGPWQIIGVYLSAVFVAYVIGNLFLVAKKTMVAYLPVTLVYNACNKEISDLKKSFKKEGALTTNSLQTMENILLVSIEIKKAIGFILNFDPPGSIKFLDSQKLRMSKNLQSNLHSLRVTLHQIDAINQ